MLYDVRGDEVLGPPEHHQLPKLYRAARADGDEPRPECAGFRFADREGWRDATRAVSESLKPTELARHADPQYTFGYYNGVLSALRGWVDRLSFDGDRGALPAIAQNTEAGAAKTAAKSAGDTERAPSVDTSVRERQLLEGVIEVLCEHVELLIRESRRLGHLRTREASLQLEVFRERKANALKLCAASSEEPWSIRVVRYERQIAALKCSRSFFNASAALTRVGALQQASSGPPATSDPRLRGT